MPTEEVLVGDGSRLGECVKLADPLPRHVERHQTPLGAFKNLSSFLPQRQHVLIPLPSLTYTQMSMDNVLAYSQRSEHITTITPTARIIFALRPVTTQLHHSRGWCDMDHVVLLSHSISLTVHDLSQTFVTFCSRLKTERFGRAYGKLPWW